MAVDGVVQYAVDYDTKGAKKSVDMLSIALKGLQAAVVVAGAKLAVDATKKAADFESQMANVATLLDGDVSKKVKGMGDDVKGLALETGASTELLTDGLYQVVSAFGDTEDSMKILQTAAKGAAAGNATVTDSVNLLSAVTKGYGDTSAGAAEKASDLAFLAVKMGQTTFPELASSMGKVIPLASGMKVSQEELFGVMATLTGVTGSAAEVSTQFRGVLQGLMKPSKGMSQILSDMGYESGQALLESEGLQGGLMALREQAEASGVPFDSLFSSVEGLTAAMALTGAQSDVWVEKQAAMMDATGATEAAFKTQTETVNAMRERMARMVDVISIGFGEKILPIVNEFLSWVIDNMPEIIANAEAMSNGFSDAVDFVQEKFAALLDVLSPVIDALKNMFSAFGEFSKGFWSEYGETISGIWSDTFEWIKETLSGALTIITDIFNIFAAAFRGDWSEMWNAIGFLIIDALLVLKNAWEGFWNIFDEIFEYADRLIQDAIEIMFEAIATLFKDFGDVVAKVWGDIWDGFKDIVDTAIEKVKDTIGAGIRWIKDKVDGILNLIKKIKIPKIPNPFKDDDPEMAAGGIVSSATRAIIGEGSAAEAVVPLTSQGISTFAQGVGWTGQAWNQPVINVYNSVDEAGITSMVIKNMDDELSFYQGGVR